MKQIISFCLKRLPLLILLNLMVSSAWSQEIIVTGKVTDAKDGTPIIGATVLVKGTTIGTSTDFDGNYSIKVPSGNSVLIFSFVGMVTQEIQVNQQTMIDVSLQVDMFDIEEVIVIGYGQVKKEDATGSVSTVSVKDFNKGNITSPLELLMGRTAGVQITQNGGAPGEGVSILIRGGSSLAASNAPLIVLDGVPLDNDGINGMRNPLGSINPNDIESFTILKDASATAIYGSRASNGVVIITTKKGRKGAPLAFNYSAKLSLNTIAKKPVVYTAAEFRKLVEDKVDEGFLPSTALGVLGNFSTDWQNEVFQSAMANEHNFSATGSYKFLPYRASLGYTNQNGILKTDNMSRFTGAISLNPSLLNDDLHITLNATATNMTNHFADRGAIGNSISFDPTQPVKDEFSGSKFGGYFTWLTSDGLGNPNGLAPTNPVALLDLRDDNSEAMRLVGNLQFDYRMPFLPELKANLNLGYDHSKSEGTVYVPKYASWSYEIDPSRDGGYKSAYDQEKKNELLDFYLNYNKEIGSISSKIEAMAGYSWQHFWRRDSSYVTNDFRDETTRRIDYAKANPTELYLVSFFGRFNYTFMDKYLFTYTLRYDGTSRFSPESRWGMFPSYALAWKISEEEFIKSIDIISDLKLRLGYGFTGQQDIGGHYLYLPTYKDSQPDAQYLFDGVPVTTSRPAGYDANIKWEETETQNIGLDFGFANNRISGSLDYYIRKTKDLLNWIPVPAGTNFTNFLFTNVGDLENKGLEIALVGRPIVSKDMYWEVSFNLTHNKNEITKLTAVDDPSYLGVATGGISGGVGSNIQMNSIGYPIRTFFVYEQIYDENGRPIEGLYVDRSGDGEITEEDRYWFKNPAPTVFMGIGSRFEYKGFDLSFLGRINLGNYVYNNVASSQGVYNNMWHSTLFLRNLPRNYDFNFNSYQYFSNYYIENASFFKMDNISFGYNFKNVGIDKLKVRVSGTIQNAFIITDYRGLDPEISDGIDNNIYPRPRIFMLGVNIDF